MAIIKDFTTGQGVVAKYHKIRNATIDCNRHVVAFEIEVYATPAAREAGFGLLWMEYPTIPFTAFTIDPRDLLYPMLSHYGDSYLKDGTTDAEVAEGPGNFNIALTDEARLPTPAVVEGPVLAVVEVQPEPMPLPPAVPATDPPAPPAPPAPPPIEG